MRLNEWIGAAIKQKYPRLNELAMAIQKHEGWQAGSRAFRNCNPGNLRSSKLMDTQYDGFAIFPDYHKGFTALLWDLYCKCSNQTVTDLTPRHSLNDLIHVYAPPSENDTEAYVESVCEYLGVDRTISLGWFVDENSSGVSVPHPTPLNPAAPGGG